MLKNVGNGFFEFKKLSLSVLLLLKRNTFDPLGILRKTCQFENPDASGLQASECKEEDVSRIAFFAQNPILDTFF